MKYTQYNTKFLGIPLNFRALKDGERETETEDRKTLTQVEDFHEFT